ncbi:MAG: xanthine dehydrogenase family protein molybdopterin-binding subunit, partial [Nitrospinota bacterium]
CVDGIPKATGDALYGVDATAPGALTGRVLRSPLPHARIARVDCSRAMRVPGVRLILTGEDVPPARFGRTLKDQSCLATGRVRYLGDRVAAVAAEEEDALEEALSLIRVDYERLPELFDPREAMAEGAAVIHPELATYPGFKGPFDHPHVAHRTVIQKGDVEAARRESDEVFEDHFELQVVHQGYLEPHGCLALPEGGRRLVIYTCTQAPFLVREILADVTGLPMSALRVVGTHVGGAFGAKGMVADEPVCALLALRTGRPVRMRMSREEEFTSGSPRHPCLIDLTTGVKRDGTVVFRDARMLFDAGAYALNTPAVIPGGVSRIGGPYRMAHFRTVGYAVYTNTTPYGQYRAPGDPQAAFASEVQMDIIAERLGVDPVEIRMRNALEEGDVAPIGDVWRHVGYKQTLRAAAERAGWGKARKARPGKAVGMGVASSERTVGIGTSGAVVKLNEDGSTTLLAGATDLGTGTDTVLLQVVAEELGLPFERCSIVSRDTENTPFDTGAGGSKTTFIAGNAVRAAALDAKRQLLELAAEELEASPEDLEFADGGVRVKGAPERKVTLAALSVFAQKQRGGPVLGRGSFNETVRNVPTFATQVAEVEVDTETGEVALLNLTLAHDCGTALNPQAVAGQLEGGAVQGLGYGLMEEMILEGGRVLTPDFARYEIPTSADVPPLHTILVEDAPGPGPFGAKAVGEPGCVPTAAAVANAIYDAVGVRMKTLPATAEKVLLALRKG